MPTGRWGLPARNTELSGLTEMRKCQLTKELLCTRGPTAYSHHAAEPEKPAADPLQIQRPESKGDQWSPEVQRLCSLRRRLQEKRKAQHKREREREPS